MNNSKKSFVLHIDTLSIVRKLNTEQKAQLLTAFLDYHTGNDLELDDVMDIVFFNFKAQFERDNKKYSETLERNKINGSKGGRPKNPLKPKKPTGLIETPLKPKKADSVSVSESVSESVSDNKRSVFVVPTVEDVFLYFQERGFQKNEAERFFDFYQSKGWMVGKNKMKDWKAAVRNWTKDKTPSINKATMTPRAFTQ